MLKPASSKVLVIVCALIILSNLLETRGIAQPSNTSFLYQYSAKCLCGRGKPPVMASGEYFTAINIHNPTEKPVIFRHKIAIAPPGSGRGGHSKFFIDSLGADDAREIDCMEIRRIAETIRGISHAPGEFLKGFVVIESPVDLDVVGVYSASGNARTVETLELERVPARHLQEGPTAKADLIEFSACRDSNNATHQWEVVVTVKNQGMAAAPASVTRINFSNGTHKDVPTPSIPASATVALPPVPIPAGCFNPDCHITVTVDVNNDVDESDETNNTLAEICIG